MSVQGLLVLLNFVLTHSCPGWCSHSIRMIACTPARIKKSKLHRSEYNLCEHQPESGTKYFLFVRPYQISANTNFSHSMRNVIHSTRPMGVFLHNNSLNVYKEIPSVSRCKMQISAPRMIAPPYLVSACIP